MHIVYFDQYFRTPADGGITRSYEQARRLVHAGHRVDMITTATDPEPDWRRGWRVSEEAGIRVHWLPVPYHNSMSFWRRIRAFVSFAVRSARHAAELRGDVVLASSTPLTIALPGAFAAWRSRAPMVFEVRDLWPDVPIAMGILRHPALIWAARRLERFAYRNAASVIASSPGMASGVVRNGAARGRVTIIPNGSDLELFRPDPEAARRFRAERPWLGDRKLVVYTGTLGKVNGVGYLVRVAAECARLNPEIRFLIVGDGRERASVEALARQLGVLDRNLFMAGFVPKSEVARVLAAADVATSLVVDVPALWDNSANKFFDGLSSGTAFAINHEGWQAELLRTSGAGLVLPATDAPAAAAMLVSALATPGWATRTGREARLLAEEKFARDKLAALLEDVLLEAVARRRRGARREPADARAGRTLDSGPPPRS